ncbi:hypothetical protein EK904_000008 [Melospiza melodia maxima]|nr:hypothetical protein EK904_000008 [Melospiza melodia maxima]
MLSSTALHTSAHTAGSTGLTLTSSGFCQGSLCSQSRGIKEPVGAGLGMKHLPGLLPIFESSSGQ